MRKMHQFKIGDALMCRSYDYDSEVKDIVHWSFGVIVDIVPCGSFSYYYVEWAEEQRRFRYEKKDISYYYKEYLSFCKAHNL